MAIRNPSTRARPSDHRRQQLRGSSATRLGAWFRAFQVRARSTRIRMARRSGVLRPRALPRGGRFSDPRSLGFTPVQERRVNDVLKVSPETKPMDPWLKRESAHLPDSPRACQVSPRTCVTQVRRHVSRLSWLGGGESLMLLSETPIRTGLFSGTRTKPRICRLPILSLAFVCSRPFSNISSAMTLEMSLVADVLRVPLVGNLRLQTPSPHPAKSYGVIKTELRPRITSSTFAAYVILGLR